MTISVTRKDIFGTMEELKQVLKGISLSYDFWVIKPHVFGFQLNALKFDFTCMCGLQENKCYYCNNKMVCDLTEEL